MNKASSPLRAHFPHHVDSHRGQRHDHHPQPLALGKDEIVNYSYPDPQYRMQTYVGIAYDTDNSMVEKIIGGAVRQVKRILPDRPMDALHNRIG